MAGELPLLDLASLGLAGGEVRELDASLGIEPLRCGGASYLVEPHPLPAQLAVGRLVGPGYELKLRFEATVVGPCVRCLQESRLTVAVRAQEVHAPGEGEELLSPYISGVLLDLGRWARDAVMLSLPFQILCRPDCRGLCPVCAANLNLAGADHHHPSSPDPRLAPLAKLWRDLSAGA